MGQEDDLRQLVPVMRELGVLEAFGVKLGPDPGIGEERKRRSTTPEDVALMTRRLKRNRYRVELGDRVDDDKFLDSLP